MWKVLYGEVKIHKKFEKNFTTEIVLHQNKKKVKYKYFFVIVNIYYIFSILWKFE